MSIVRIVHNKENPYVILNKKALWDTSLSLKAVGLWARCMSKPNDWRFNVKDLVKTSKEGRRTIDGAIKELIDAGYAIRIEHWEKREDGKFKNGGVEYVFFEFAATQEDKDLAIEEFKKSFRHCSFGNSRNGDCRNDHLLSTNKEELYKEKTKERPEPNSGPQSDPPSISQNYKKEYPEETKELCLHLKNRLKGHFPKIKEPNEEKWYGDMDKLIRLDKKAVSDIKEMIDWSMDSVFWVKQIHSADSLRRHFDKMLMQKETVNNVGTYTQQNRISAQEAKSAIKKNDKKFYDFQILVDGVIKVSSNEKILFSLQPAEFDARLAEVFELTISV